MAELMTSEAIVEAYWQMKGYWTRPRFPLRVKNGWSDVDLLGYHPEEKSLVISESKVRGPKDIVYAYTDATRSHYGNIFKFDGGNYLSFLEHVKQVCTDRGVFKHFTKLVSKVVVQLVSNYYVAPSQKTAVEGEVSKKVRGSIPKRVKLDVHLDTTLDVFSKIVEMERSSNQGRRYGHPVIDLAREMNRYMHPDVRYAGRQKAGVEEVKSSLRQTFLDSFGIGGQPTE